MKTWDDLSIKEKADIMGVAISNGITTLPEIKAKYNEFAEGGSKEEEAEVDTIIPFTQRTEVIVTPDAEYNQYLNTLPDNQRFTPNDRYDSYLYWKLNGRPRDFKEAYNKGMFTYDHSDNAYHANSIAFGPDGVGYFMKPKDHDTVGYELDWFNKGLVTEEGGWQRPETFLEWKESQPFRNSYILMDDPNRPNYYMYQPIERASGGKIHIKPENRGKFTALKKRTGHSASWFKAHGTPAQKKMAVFDLNSRHWKHGLGGNLFSGEEDYSSQMNNNLSTVPRRTVYKATKTGRVWNTEAEAAKDNYNYDNDIHYRYHIKAGNYKSPLVNYNIPFIPEKQITLTNAGLATGAILSTNLLDSIAVNAEKAGLPIKTGMGLATKESTLNNPTSSVLNRAKISVNDRDAIATSKINGYFIPKAHQQKGNRNVSESDLINFTSDDNPYLSTMMYLNPPPRSGRRSRITTQEEFDRKLKESELYDDRRATINQAQPSKSYLQAGFEVYKKNPYAWNPGQPNYPQLVDKRGEEVWNSPEVQKWYREYQKNKKALGGNLFAPGGYIPTDKVKKRITQWEGAAMTGAIDPLSGKFLTNNSFEYEADAFTKALPENIREQVLSNQELADNLYSYSYNVGAGKFKERVVPALLKYFAGEGSPYEIANSMWASGDKKLRGLRNRRGIEKKRVIDSLVSPYPVEPTNSIVVSNPFIDIQQPIPAPIMVPDENQYVSVHTQTQEDIDRQEQQRAIERLNNIERFNRLMNLINVQNNQTPTFIPQNAPYTVNSNAFGGNLFDGFTQPTQQMDKTYDVGFLPEIVIKRSEDPIWILGQKNPDIQKDLWTAYEKENLSDNVNDSYYPTYLSKPQATRLLEVYRKAGNPKIKSLSEGKHRAYYNPFTNTMRVDTSGDFKATLEDIAEELAHPLQTKYGNNAPWKEHINVFYNSDAYKDATRYNYPETYEGETHYDFEPLINYYINKRIIPGQKEITGTPGIGYEESVKNPTFEQVLDSAKVYNRRRQENDYKYPDITIHQLGPKFYDKLRKIRDWKL